MIGPFFSLRKSRKTFRFVHRHYQRKKQTLDEYTKESIQGYLTALREAILQKDNLAAKKMAKELEAASLRLMPKTSFDKTRDFLGGLAFALIIAVLIRTTWFELYTIPSGSMRPTLKEEDYLVVSKTDYGINVPLQVKHFHFDPDLVQRGSIIVFNGANMDIQDADTVYFYLFPGKKQFVKRLIGKPGDTIYFYGGDIYGVDQAGNELLTLRESEWFKNLEHIPFIRFNGKVQTPIGAKNGFFSKALFSQMNIPVAKLEIAPNGKLLGEVIPQRGKSGPDSYADLLGMKHFAMARLLTKAEAHKIHPFANLEEGLLYLELTHHPKLQGAELSRDEYNRLRPELSLSHSIIPLQSKHLENLSKSMTTCRFTVKDGLAWRLGWNPKGMERYLPKLPGVPNGTYEIQNGKVYALPLPKVPLLGVFTNGVTKEVAPDHPLYSQDPKMIHTLYNLGIEFLNHYLPKTKQQPAVPSRYAYFKNGDLHLLGSPILSQGDSTLEKFIQNEMQKASLTYEPFIDLGAPTIEEIQKNGITVPEKMYLALGDNHAMSADSREFGFVPEDNLKGGVSFLFAPIGERLGKAAQPQKKHMTFPNLTVIALFSLAAIASTLYSRRKLKKPLKF